MSKDLDQPTWYECQEAAMAPGISGEWPAVIPVPGKGKNVARLVRKDGPHPDDMADEAATARTREIVERLRLGHAFDFGRPRLDDENRIADWIEREYLDMEDDHD